MNDSAVLWTVVLVAIVIVGRLLSMNRVRHPPRSGWLDELGRLKGGWAMGLGVARCAPY
jgi:hypothetical protein